MKRPHRAVFLDRDGTINTEVNYLNNIDQLKLIDGTPEAIQILNDMNLRVIVITNQAAVARGFLNEDDLTEIHQTLCNMLAEKGAMIDAVYYCPHHPTEGKDRYLQVCDCRKPRPGMLYRAAEDWRVDLTQSYVIGDKLSDLQAGAAAGCRTILVLTGYGREQRDQIPQSGLVPDYIADDLLEAAKWIVRREKEDGHAG